MKCYRQRARAHDCVQDTDYTEREHMDLFTKRIPNPCIIGLLPMMATTSANMCPLDILSKPACGEGDSNMLTEVCREELFKSHPKAGCGSITVKLSTWEGVYEFEASLLYIENSRPVRAT